MQGSVPPPNSTPQRTPHNVLAQSRPLEKQALFVPIDSHVHAGARRCGVAWLLSRYSVVAIQSDPSLHREAAKAIVTWSRRRQLDPRDVDVYWYTTGRGNLARDGTAPER